MPNREVILGQFLSAVLRQARGKGDSAEEERLHRKHAILLRANLLLGIVVLIFTALARVAA